VEVRKSLQTIKGKFCAKEMENQQNKKKQFFKKTWKPEEKVDLIHWR
jgi:hypothetical protein